MKRAPFKVGDKVRVEPRHWLRGNQTGRIVDISKDRFLVQFPGKRADGGIDGNKIWLQDAQFRKV